MRHPLRRLLLCAALAFAPLFASFSHLRNAAAFPKPSVYPLSWQIKFEHSGPKRIVVAVPGSDVPTAYWYMTFTVTNQTDQEISFLPVFDMVTDTGSAIRSDKDIPAEVFAAVKKRERKATLEPMEKIAGRLLIGEDQSRDGVAIWPEPLKRMGSFQIFAGGLSGESVFMKNGEEFKVKDWTTVTDEERKQLSTLRKTLQMNYQIPGDEIRPQNATVISKGEEWIMR